MGYHLCSVMNKVQISLSFSAGGYRLYVLTLLQQIRVNGARKHNDSPLVCPQNSASCRSSREAVFLSCGNPSRVLGAPYKYHHLVLMGSGHMFLCIC